MKQNGLFMRKLDQLDGKIDNIITTLTDMRREQNAKEKTQANPQKEKDDK